MARRVALVAFLGAAVIASVVMATNDGQGHKWGVERVGPAIPADSPAAMIDNPKEVPDAPRSGTAIQYDSGNFNAQATTYEFVHGNRFDSNSGAPIATGGVITQVQFYMFAMSDSVAWCSFYGPPVGTVAPVITAFSRGGVGLGMNTVAAGPFNIAVIGTDFLAGALNFNSPGNTGGDGVGLDVGGTNAGQGFHGMMIHSTFTPTGYAAFPGTNTIFRVLGTGLPVELKEFEIE